jgi:hypothetical protein
MPTNNGLKVVSIIPGSSAEKAGIKLNDIMTHYDTSAVNDISDFRAALGKSKKQSGDDVQITIIRDSEEINLSVPHESLGVHLRELNSNLELRYVPKKENTSFEAATILNLFAWLTLIIGCISSIIVYNAYGTYTLPTFPYSTGYNPTVVILSIAIFVNSILGFLVMHVISRTGTEVMRIKEMISKIR